MIDVTGGINSIRNDGQGGQQQGGGGGGGGGAGGPGPLAGLAQQIGMEGTFAIPAFGGAPPMEVEKIYLLILAIATYFFGWKVLLVAGVFYVIQVTNKMAPSAQGGGGQQGRPMSMF